MQLLVDDGVISSTNNTNGGCIVVVTSEDYDRRLSRASKWQHVKATLDDTTIPGHGLHRI